MRKTNITLVVAIIILLVFWKLNKADLVTAVNTASINNDQHEIVVEPNSAINKKQQAQTHKEAIIEDYNFDDLSIATDLDYLTAFRDYTYFLLCKSIITDLNNKTQPIISYRKRIKHFEKFGYTGGDHHDQFFLKHVDQCADYLLHDDEIFQHASTRLKKTYQSIEPKTNEEKELDKILALIEETNNLYTQLNSLKRGNSTLTTKAIKQIRLKIDNIRKINNQFTTIPKEQRNTQQQAIINSNNDRIKSLRQSIRDSYHKDGSLIESLSVNYQVQVTKLNQDIISTKSADIFALLTRWYSDQIVNPQFNKIFETIYAKAQKELNLSHGNYPIILARSALPLFACALGYPCDADSQIILLHCITFANRNACGRGVEDFYLNQYISPNTFQDVNQFLSFLFEHYAQEK